MGIAIIDWTKSVSAKEHLTMEDASIYFEMAAAVDKGTILKIIDAIIAYKEEPKNEKKVIKATIFGDPNLVKNFTYNKLFKANKKAWKLATVENAKKARKYVNEKYKNRELGDLVKVIGLLLETGKADEPSSTITKETNKETPKQSNFIDATKLKTSDFTASQKNKINKYDKEFGEGNETIQDSIDNLSSFIKQEKLYDRNQQGMKIDSNKLNEIISKYVNQ